MHIDRNDINSLRLKLVLEFRKFFTSRYTFSDKAINLILGKKTDPLKVINAKHEKIFRDGETK